MEFQPLGVGAMNSPRYRLAGLRLCTSGRRIMFNGGAATEALVRMRKRRAERPAVLCSALIAAQLPGLASRSWLVGWPSLSYHGSSRRGSSLRIRCRSGCRPLAFPQAE